MNRRSTQHNVSSLTTKQKNIALLIVATAFVMDLLDTTIVNIAIPSIQIGLGVNNTTIQWLVAGYVLAFALLLVTGGRMGDVFGYKKMFLTGVGGFTVASLLCGSAEAPEVLVFGRLLQGSMAALMVPQVMSLVQVMYVRTERGKVLGRLGMLGGLAASLGPVLGGFLIEANLFGFGWRPIFLINVPIGIAAFIAGFKFLPSSKSSHPLRLDLIGTGILVIALGLLIFPLIQGRELNWPAWILWMLGASLPTLTFFAWFEYRKDRKDKSALVVPALFRLRSFVGGISLNLLFHMAMMTFFLTFTLVLQYGLGFSVISAAVISVPTAIGIGVSMALIGQRLVKKFGRYVITVATGVTAIGLTLNALVLNHSPIDVIGWFLAPGLLITGIGMGLFMATVYSITLQDVDRQHAGSASGILSAISQIGPALGVALIGIIFFGQLIANAPKAFDQEVAHLQKELTSLQVLGEAQTSILASAMQCFVDRSAQKDTRTVPESCIATDQSTAEAQADTPLPGAITKAIHKATTNNFIWAYNWGHVFSLSIMTAIFVLSFVLPRHLKSAEKPM